MTRSLLLLIAVVVLFASCRERMCTTYGISGITITASSNMPDTLLRVVRYHNDGSFTQPVDSFVKSNDGYPTNNFMILIDTMGSMTGYNYDYACTMYPSGKTFKVSALTHESGKGHNGMSCVNPIHYNVNGTTRQESGYLGMMGFMITVPYQ